MLKHGTIGDSNASRLSHLLTGLAKKISNSLDDSNERATEVPGLKLYRWTAPTAPNPSTYEPSLLVIAQGRIRVDLGKGSYVFGRSRFLLTSLELPVVSQVVTASKEAPYLAFFLKLDMSILRDILNTEEVHIPAATSGACGMALGQTAVELVNSCSRMMDLLGAPRDISFFGKLIQREIIYRLL
jgi:AraC-type transcriptional regulator N-terminus